MPTSEGIKRRESVPYVQRAGEGSSVAESDLLMHRALVVTARLTCASLLIVLLASVASQVGGVVAWSLAGVASGLLASFAVDHYESERKP